MSRLEFEVKPESLPLFTTVLQSGIEVMTANGVTLGRLLSSFPGFTADYLAETVQTIFLNGTAIDDLTTPLSGAHPVLALSAAMPGLAGAIFRKNSFHAALRTETKSSSHGPANDDGLTVTMKLFNSIARDRGEELLHRGVSIKTGHLEGFLAIRPNLLDDIKVLRLNDTAMDKADLPRILATEKKVNLIVTKSG